jgi:hypothetical protein
MKKLYALVVFASLSLSAFSQAYIPLIDSASNTWYFAWNVVPVRTASQAPNCSYPLFPNSPSWTYSTIYDTTANGYLYKAIGVQYYGIPNLDCVAGYLREDTAARQVYFMDNQFGVEELLYDFSMQPGDSITINFASPGFYQNGIYILDSISPINLISGVHRLFFLHNSLNPPQMGQLQWIEGVGNPGNLLYQKSANFGGGLFAGCGWPPDMINRYSSDILTCFYQGTEKIYFDSCAHAVAFSQQGSQWFSYVDSCVYWNLGGSVEEINGLTSINAAPNPADNTTLVVAEATTNLEGEMCLRDISGRTVRKPVSLILIPGRNTIPIETGALEAGIYLIEFRTRNGVASARLAISR